MKECGVIKSFQIFGIFLSEFYFQRNWKLWNWLRFFYTLRNAEGLSLKAMIRLRVQSVWQWFSSGGIYSSSHSPLTESFFLSSMISLIKGACHFVAGLISFFNKFYVGLKHLVCIHTWQKRFPLSFSYCLQISTQFYMKSQRNGVP